MRAPVLAWLSTIASLAILIPSPAARAQSSPSPMGPTGPAEQSALPSPASWGADADAEIPARELRVLPMDPCLRLTLALSELDRQEARASCLASTRLANRDDRIDEGIVLLGFGLLSAIAGGATAGIGANDGDDLLLAAGLGTAGWGVVNAAFSAALFDVTGSGLRDIEDGRGLTSEALLRARDEAAAAQDETAMIIAVNAGLDVFYVATGLLLWVLGREAEPEERWLEGYGLAMTVQGAALLVYDGVTWAFAADRASRMRSLLRE